MCVWGSTKLRKQKMNKHCRSLPEPRSQPIIYPKYKSTTGHRSRDRDPATRVQPSHPLRTIQLPRNSRKRPLANGPRPELRFCLHRALNRVGREKGEVVCCACTRATQRTLGRAQLSLWRVPAQKFADELFGPEPRGRSARLSDERPSLAQPQPADASRADYVAQDGIRSREVSNGRGCEGSTNGGR